MGYTKLERLKKSMDYAAKQASKCRHERYQVSCLSCKDEKTCDIQLRFNKALEEKKRLT